MSFPMADAVSEAVAEDPHLLTTALTVVDRLSAPILQFARSAWGPQGAARSSGYGGGGGGYGGGGPSPLDTALSALALLAFALFFLNSILPLITGGMGGGGRSSPADDPLPLDLNQEALNLITSWALSRPNYHQPDTQ